jgi:predicted nucleic acid-binding protein
MILLDTMAFAAAMRPAPNARLVAWLDEQPIDGVFLAATSVADLLRDVVKLPAKQRKDWRGETMQEAIIRLFGSRILSFDTKAAASYGDMMMVLKRNRHSISRAQALVAAVAKSYELPVAAVNSTPFLLAGCVAIQIPL